MNLLVQTQIYLTLVANHRTTNNAKIYMSSTSNGRQLRAICDPFFLQVFSIYDIVLVNSESVSL